MKIHSTVAVVFLSAAVAAPAFAQRPDTARPRAANEQDRRPSPDEMRFRGMDTDNDGVITKDEWRGNAQSFREHDTNGDGVLSGAEVRRPAVVAPDESRREQLMARFTRADRNHDERLIRDEWWGDAAAFNRMDRNGNGVVTRDEFLAAIPDRPAATSGAVPANASRAYRAGYERGRTDGTQAGREDKTVNGGKWDLDGQRELEQADAGYNADLGTRTDYQSGYRAGFRVGYREGFGAR